MKELDFSHFKKIQQDKKSAVLKHPDGHEIKIAISGLSPILKKKLIALPLHASDQKKPIEALDEDSPASAEPQEGSSAPNIDLAGVKEDMAPSLSPEALDQSVLSPTPGPASTPAQPAMPPAPPEAPKQPAAAVPPSDQAPAPAAPPTPEQEAQQMTAHNLAFADDLKYGHIQPKTYRDLFDQKSTLGKAGTLFGLLLSGVGSGLTGQPNALLGLMDKQIERDLEAQKQDQSNKQNWYKAALEHEKNQPENMKRWAEAQASMSDADFKDWSNQQAGVIKSKASVDAMNAQRAAMAQSFQDSINKMPPGPQKLAAQAQHDNMVAPYLLNKAAQDNLNTAQQKATVNALNPMPLRKSNPPPKGVAKAGVKYDSVNENKMNAMIQKGKFAPGAADAIPPQFVDAINKEKTELAVNRNNLADADDSFQALAKMKSAGQVPAAGFIPGAATGLASIAGALGTGGLGGAFAGALGNIAGHKLGDTVQTYFERNRAIQVEALKSRLGGNMSQEDKNKLAEALLPSWTDTPESMAEAHRKMIQHFESNPAETAPNLTRFGLKHPLPNYEFKSEKVKEKEEPKAKAKSKAGASGGF